MGEGKLLVIFVAVILTIGVIGSSLIGGLIPQQEVEDTWVHDTNIHKVGGYFISIFQYGMMGITWTFEAVANLFGADTDKETITISGTGEDYTNVFYGSVTLDGSYNYYKNPKEFTVLHDIVPNADKVFPAYIDGYLGMTYTIGFVNVNYTDSSNTTVDKAWISTSNSGVEYSNRIYEATTTGNQWYSNWTLIDTSKDYNSYAQGDYSEPLSPDETATGGVKNFFEDVKKQVENSILTFGLIPKAVGIPIFIILFLGIIYAIIKIFPWT